MLGVLCLFAVRIHEWQAVGSLTVAAADSFGYRQSVHRLPRRRSRGISAGDVALTRPKEANCSTAWSTSYGTKRPFERFAVSSPQTQHRHAYPWHDSINSEQIAGAFRRHIRLGSLAPPQPYRVQPRAQPTRLGRTNPPRRPRASHVLAAPTTVRRRGSRAAAPMICRAPLIGEPASLGCRAERHFRGPALGDDSAH